MSIHKNHKRIAVNTLMLYIRMFIVMLVSLYTSRIVLNELGIQDFGIYSLVGGIVGMMGFMNNAMTSATQRFLSFEIGRNDSLQTRNVFNMSLNIHLIVAIIFLLLAETIGLWFVKTQIEIPLERINALLWVYQFSVFTLLLNIISVPYYSIIIAYERMGFFAILSIVEVVLQLFVIYLIQFVVEFDILIFYAFLLFCVSFIVRSIYFIHCNISYKESKFKFYWNNELFKNLFSHIRWMLLGTSANMLGNQGLNILINIFFGVTVNAARGIAFQIQGAVHSFIVNFMLAVRPQIIKTYAQKNFEEMYRLLFTSSKFSFYLLLYISLPVMLLTGSILKWWLKIIPDDSIIFTQLIIIDLFFIVLFTSLTTVSQASDKIKSYQIIVTLGYVLLFGLSYIIFKLGYPAYFAFIIALFISSLSLVFRLINLKSSISFPVYRYVKEVLFRVIAVVLFATPIPIVILYKITDPLQQFLFVTIFSFFSVSMSIWLVGITNSERKFVKEKLRAIYSKFKKLMIYKN